MGFRQVSRRPCHRNGGGPLAMTILCADVADLLCPPPSPARRHPARGLALSPVHAQLPGRGYRNMEDLLAERGLDVTYETIRRWVLKFGPAIARNLRRLRPRPS